MVLLLYFSIILFIFKYEVKAEFIVLEGRGSLSVLWRRVMIRPPDNEDLQNILIAWYPNLEPLVDKLTGILHEFLLISSFT